jgi:hypothetical protein
LETEVPMLVTRMTVDLIRPVPIAPLEVTARPLRTGRRVQLAEATIAAGGTVVARASALRIRRTEVDLPIPPDTDSAPTDPAGLPAWDDSRYPAGEMYHTAGVELRYAAGELGRPGPATVWVRLRQRVLPGEEPTPLMRVAAAADFGNGVSPVLDPAKFFYMNPDLTIYLHREPVGDWVCIEARTWVEPEGRGLAESALYDRRGRIGRSLQGLLVEPR